MNIIICASISAADEVLKVKKSLEKLGHIVEIPTGITHEFLKGRSEVSHSEKAADKIKFDVLRNYFEKIKRSDAVLVVNPDKRGIRGYIGANTLIEMSFAHVLGKKIYVIYPLPNIQYNPEILATQPIVLHGDLSKIR